MDTRTEYAQWRDELAGHREPRYGAWIAIMLAAVLFTALAWGPVTKGVADPTHYGHRASTGANDGQG